MLYRPSKKCITSRSIQAVPHTFNWPIVHTQNACKAPRNSIPWCKCCFLINNKCNNKSKVHHYHFQGRLYRSNDKVSKFHPLVTREEDIDYDRGPFKQTNTVFLDRASKAVVYRFTLFVNKGKNTHQFQLSCKGRAGLPRNKVIKRMCGINWSSDIFVLRVGKFNPQRPVDMQGRDKDRVNYVVRK